MQSSSLQAPIAYCTVLGCFGELFEQACLLRSQNFRELSWRGFLSLRSFLLSQIYGELAFLELRHTEGFGILEVLLQSVSGLFLFCQYNFWDTTTRWQWRIQAVAWRSLCMLRSLSECQGIVGSDWVAREVLVIDFLQDLFKCVYSLFSEDNSSE